MNSFWSKYGISAVAVVLIVAAFMGGVYVGESRIPAVDRIAGLVNKEYDPLSLTAAAGEEEVDFAPFWRVWNILDSKFVPRSTSTDADIDTQDRVWSAIEGLVATYDDPYTVFFRPQESEAFKESAKGTFEGVGMVVGVNEGKLVVVAPLEGSPAMLAGVKAGDVITKIDGVDSATFSTDKAVDLIRGPKGTEVNLTLLRDGADKPIDVSIVRGDIDIPSTNTGIVSRDVRTPKEGIELPTKTVVDPETGEEKTVAVPIEDLPDDEVEVAEQDFFVLKLYSFSESSMRAFKKGLEEFATAKTNKLIIDLRGNPGGFLEAAVDMASYFIPEGDVVVREIVGADKEERVHRSKGRALLEGKNVKLVVLIDHGSASASEILAGALQEYGVATLVGTKSFGKGSVQELVDITGDISLKVTIARWYTPKGRSISEHGLVPDVIVDLKSVPQGVRDPILEAGIDELTKDAVTETPDSR